MNKGDSIRMYIKDLETPFVFIDLNILENNIAKMQKHLSNNNIKCRPHVKTHKIPAIAHMQIDAGAVGITCQKLTEAEVMINAGIKDILIPYNIVGKQKICRLMRLVKQAKITVTVDSEFTLRGINEAAKKECLIVPILVEADTGAKKAGVQTIEQAILLGELIESLSNVQFKGILTFMGGALDNNFRAHIKYSSNFFKNFTEALSRKGISVETISSGGTVYANAAWPDYNPFGVTECRPGVYVYYDCVKVSFGVASYKDCAMKIVSTVVSRPTSDRAVLDAGSKTLTLAGSQWVEGFGHIIEYPKAKIVRLSEEHGISDFSGYKRKPSIGERVTIIPNYCNNVTNAHDLVYGVRNGHIETMWPVAARGKVL